MNNGLFLTLVNGIVNAVRAITTSAGVADANKILATSSTGKLDKTLLPSDSAYLSDITDKLRYGKFTALNSSTYCLFDRASIIGQSGGKQGCYNSYWGLQIGGLRAANILDSAYLLIDPPNIPNIQATSSFCVAIQAQTSTPIAEHYSTSLGTVSSPFDVLALYGTSWHTHGNFLTCRNSGFATILAIDLSGNVSIQGNRVLTQRQIGWTAATGDANKNAFDTTTATLQQCAERIKALEDAMRTHGLIN